MDDTRGKRGVIDLSSSSSEEDVGDRHDKEDSDSESKDGDEDEQDEDYDDDQCEASESNDSDDDDDDVDDESLADKVAALLQEGNDIESLKLKECKAYLRKHGLRLAGSRADCVSRIREHWRIKDGNAYMLYPRSSFIIDCTGDVCKGDVVLFRQKVYEKFNKVTRHGRLLGNRTVAGRVVKESYGAAKQQHTFTVEVIWSSGFRKLPPLCPLLVKGRNLYKQELTDRWKNEADRVKVLSEKHGRGAAARFLRSVKQKKKNCFANGSKGSKRQLEFRNTKRSKIGRSREVEKVRHLDGCKRAIDFQPSVVTSSTQATWKENGSSRAFRSTSGWPKPAEIHHYQVPVYPSYANYQQSSFHSQLNTQSRNEPREFFYYERGLIPNKIESPPFRPHVNEFTSRSRPQMSGDNRYGFETKNLNAGHVVRPLSPRTKKFGWRKHGL